MTRLSLTLLGYLTGLLLCTPVIAVEPTQGMTITGDKELPQVLYIIPWKEQQPEMPPPPKRDNPLLRPLTPCDTDQTMAEYQTQLWDCAAIAAPSKP